MLPKKAEFETLAFLAVLIAIWPISLYAIIVDYRKGGWHLVANEFGATIEEGY